MTSNHIHLLVKVSGLAVVQSSSVQSQIRTGNGAGMEELALPMSNGWSEAIAVGSLVFVEKVKSDLGVKAMHREVLETDGTYALRESGEAYAGKFVDETDALRSENTILWDESVVDARI